MSRTPHEATPAPPPAPPRAPLASSLYAKLSAVLVALLAAVGLAYAVASYYGARHHVAQINQSVNRDLARTLVADRNLVQEGRINEDAVKQTFDEYMTINPSIEIYLLGLDGRILSYSADPGKVKRRTIALEPIVAFMAGDARFPLLGDDPRSHDGRKPFSVTPVPTESAPEGFLYVVLRGERYDSVERLLTESYLLRQSGLVVVASLVLGAVVGLVMFHVLTRRLRRLSVEMDTFRRSSFTHHLALPAAAEGGDEIDQLTRTFDAMAQRIVEQIDALKRQDSLRRELVAQISHDLRTPLTALHGYLETLQLKASALESDERAEYLDIAMRQSERLRRLVSDLFELAKLEAREQRPKQEPIAVVDLLQDVSQKMAIAARDAAVAIDLDLPDGSPIASGDVALLERVLDNLIDNAIDHAGDGGTVRIGTRTEAGAVSVFVQDSGPGIPPEDIPRLFEPYYRGDASKRPASAHAGLGLAIARRIVELHGGTIRVASRQGEGARFEFTLAGG